MKRNAKAAALNLPLAMFTDRVSTAYKLFRDGGVRNVYDYSWLRLRVLAGERRKEVKLDGCVFNLQDILDPGTRIELITKKYEAAERRAVTRYLRRDLPVIELGGSMGVVACVTNKLLQNPRAHVVVEANPRAAAQLGHNRRLNGCEFEIVNCAIAYGTSSVNFRPSTNMAGSSITRPGDEMPVTVDAIQLGRIVEGRGLGPFSLICDIEGVEYDLVCQEIAVLAKAHTIIMETHARYIGEDKLRLMMAKLAEAGFKIIEEIGFVVVLQK